MILQITKAIVIENEHAADHVSVITNLPDPCWPYTGHLDLSFSAAFRSGAQYVRQHFNIEPEIINLGKKRL